MNLRRKQKKFSLMYLGLTQLNSYLVKVRDESAESNR